MIIRQGDIYWIDLGQPIGSEPGYLRPFEAWLESDFY